MVAKYHANHADHPFHVDSGAMQEKRLKSWVHFNRNRELISYVSGLTGGLLAAWRVNGIYLE